MYFVNKMLLCLLCFCASHPLRFSIDHPWARRGLAAHRLPADGVHDRVRGNVAVDQGPCPPHPPRRGAGECAEDTHSGGGFQGKNFTIEALLGDKARAKAFVGGSISVHRLAPQVFSGRATYPPTHLPHLRFAKVRREVPPHILQSALQ